VNEIQDLDRRGCELLDELAANPGSDCWKQFFALFFEPVRLYLVVNRSVLAIRVARHLKADGIVAPVVPSEQVNEIAHEATLIALRRVCENAARFDPKRGTPTMWVIGNAHWAWIDVVKAIAVSNRVDFVSPGELTNEPDTNPTTEEHVLRKLTDTEALAEAASHVSEKEFAAIRLVVTDGYSYAETAKLMFGDESMTKQIDGLLTRGKRKLAEAWADRRPSPSSASGSKLQGPADDKEVSDG
jgi:DNA-directed RNA polymerase specialized sigma24 family protein